MQVWIHSPLSIQNIRSGEISPDATISTNPFFLLRVISIFTRHKCVQLIAITFTQRVEGFSIVPRLSLLGAYHLITKHGRCCTLSAFVHEDVVTIMRCV